MKYKRQIENRNRAWYKIFKNTFWFYSTGSLIFIDKKTKEYKKLDMMKEKVISNNESLYKEYENKIQIFEK